MKTSQDILKRYWNYSEFRPFQEEIVDDCINGNDVLALLPTGGGKSICFQVPGLAREGLCIVVSPLIALMQDQVQNLKKLGIKSIALTSSMSYREIDIELDNAKYGSYKFLYVSPERLQTTLFKERLKQMNVSLFVVDEAHCISEWGYDFRPSYLNLSVCREFHPNVPILALTATATEKVQNDIIEKLQLKKSKKHIASNNRKNIYLEICSTHQKYKRLVQFCKEISGIGIVYCRTRKQVKDVAKLLLEEKIACGIYHGGMTSESRSKMLNNWLMEDIKVMVATNAFGMGIDKPNVRYVIHFEIPNSIEAYIQEYGRAGRDGNQSKAIVLFNEQDLKLLNQQLLDQFPDKTIVVKHYIAVCNFLKLAIGSGLNETYNLNYKVLCEKYKLESRALFFSLKILEQNGFLVLSDSNFQPSKIHIIVDRLQLYDFQIKHEKYQDLITYLQRMIPGIHQGYKFLFEKELCSQLKIEEKEMVRLISGLQKYGIVDIKWSNEHPQITFLKERVSEMDFNLDPEKYFERKKQFKARIESIKNFALTKECRTKNLLNYFNEQTNECNNCDNCLKKNHPYIKEKLLKKIKELNTVESLSNELNITENHCMNIIQELILEEIIAWDGEGYKLI